jgi:GT2 family glycosyltransferase
LEEILPKGISQISISKGNVLVCADASISQADVSISTGDVSEDLTELSAFEALSHGLEVSHVIDFGAAPYINHANLGSTQICAAYVNKLRSWTLDGVDNLQIEISDRDNQIEVDLNPSFTLPKTETSICFRTWLGVHHAKGDFILRLTGLESGTEQIFRKSFVGSKRGGKTIDSFDFVDFTLPAMNENTKLAMSVAVKEVAKGKYTPWFLIVSPMLSTATVPVQLGNAVDETDTRWFTAPLPEAASNDEKCSLVVKGMNVALPSRSQGALILSKGPGYSASISSRPTENFPREIAFDAKWYKAAYGLPDITSDDQALAHYETKGEAMGQQPSPYFTPGFVRAQLKRLGVSLSGNLRRDYLDHASRVSPHTYLPVNLLTTIDKTVEMPSDLGEWYNPSVRVLRHMDTQSSRHSPFFDPDFILTSEGEKPENPLRYYLENLSLTDCQTSVLFDPEYYGSLYPDVRAKVNKKAGLGTLFEHFMKNGIHADNSPFADFDLEYYKRTNPDVADAVRGGSFSWTHHFLFYGIKEGRDPNPFFNSQYYIEQQPDVLGTIKRLKLAGGPLEHFLKIGYKAGYKANRPLHSVAVPDLDGKALYEKRCNVTTTALLRSKEKITFPKYKDAPDLSCIIPVVNQAHMTVHLLRQLSAAAWRRDMPSIEVVVVDNGSNDLTRDLGELTEGVTIVRRETALGYPLACNLGAEAATGKMLLFMNNDIEVNSESLKRGVEVLNDQPQVGAVGGRIILTNGLLQESGNVLFDDASARGIGRFADPDLPQYNHPREVDYCSGCFLFVRKTDFKKLNGFDEIYSPGYYEEADLCFRLKEVGLKSYFDPAIYMYHYEYASYSKGRPPNVSTSLMRRNQRTFMKRHSKRLFYKRGPASDQWRRDLLQSRDDGARTIALVEDHLPDPALGSGFVRTATLLDSMLDAGYRVILFVMHYKYSDIEDTLRQKGVEVIKCYAHDHGKGSPIAGREWDIDLVWVCRTHSFKKWSNWVRTARGVNPDIKTIFDTEAIATLRDVEYRKLMNLAQPEDIDAHVAEELESSVQPDAIIVVNQIDQKAVQKISDRPVYELGHLVEARQETPALKGRTGLFFCGSFHSENSPNFDSIRYFVDEVWPLVLQQTPDATLKIAGHISPGVPLEGLVKDIAGIEYVGRVDDLASYFDAARCFIAPTRYAGGVPHKVHESMAAGLPVVCSHLLRKQLATETVASAKVPVLSAQVINPAEFAEACSEILEDDKLWVKQQQSAFAYIEETASKKVFQDNLKGILDDHA